MMEKYMGEISNVDQDSWTAFVHCKLIIRKTFLMEINAITQLQIWL